MAGMNLGFGRTRPQYDSTAAEPYNALQRGNRSLAPEHKFVLDPSGTSANMAYVPPSPASAFVGRGGINYGDAASAQASYGPQGGSASSASNTRSNDALAALEAQIRGGGADRYTAPQTPIEKSGYEVNDAADRAQYGKAKERVGMALQSALKGLRESMAARGIGGSGVEADQMGDLFAQGLGELANTDRALAENNSSRAFTANQADTDRTIQQQQYNATSQTAAEQARMASQNRNLEMLLQIARGYS